MSIYALMLLAPMLAPAQHAQQSCLLQTGQARGLLDGSDPTDFVESKGTESNEDGGDGIDKEFVPEVVEMLKEMEDMSLNKSVGSKEVREALNTMMKKFDLVVDTQFHTAFGETQANIRRYVMDFERAHSIAMKAKQTADEANIALGDCRRQEAFKFENYSACLDESRWMNKTSEEACSKAASSRFYKWGIDDVLKQQHECDLADPLCPKLDDLKTHVDELASLLASRRKSFNDNHAQCNATRAAALRKATECEFQHVDFLGKKMLCDGQEVRAQVSMCAFGHRLQEQCGLLDATNKFISMVREGRGTKESETDRRNNWLKAQSMKCLLKSYTVGGGVDADVKNLCERDHSYKDDVGEMDYMSDKILSLLRPAPPSFTCHETHILFAGPLWHVGNLTDKYVMKDRTEDAVNITPPLSGPFEFCAANSSRMPCRGFQCPPDWAPKPERIDSTCELKVCSEYECCERVVGLFAKRGKPVVGSWKTVSDGLDKPVSSPATGLSAVVASAGPSPDEDLEALPSDPVAGLFAHRGEPIVESGGRSWDGVSKAPGTNPVGEPSSELDTPGTHPAAGLFANRGKPVAESWEPSSGKASDAPATSPAAEVFGHGGTPVASSAGGSSGDEMLDEELEMLAPDMAIGLTSEASPESQTFGMEGTGPKTTMPAGENEIMAKRSPQRSAFGA